MAVNKKCPKCGSEQVQLSNESSKHGCLFLILFGWIFLVPFSSPLDLIHIKYSLPVIASVVGLGFVPTVLSYILYITGLSYGVEASKAGIISSIEIVVSVIISAVLFKEVVWGVKLLGIVLAVGSIIIVKFDKNVISLNKEQEKLEEVL